MMFCPLLISEVSSFISVSRLQKFSPLTCSPYTKGFIFSSFQKPVAKLRIKRYAQCVIHFQIINVFPQEIKCPVFNVGVNQNKIPHSVTYPTFPISGNDSVRTLWYAIKSSFLSILLSISAPEAYSVHLSDKILRASRLFKIKSSIFSPNIFL